VKIEKIDTGKILTGIIALTAASSCAYAWSLAVELGEMPDRVSLVESVVENHEKSLTMVLENQSIIICELQKLNNEECRALDLIREIER